LIQTAVEQLGDELLAQTLDVHGVAGREVHQAQVDLRRAGQVGAARHGFALRIEFLQPGGSTSSRAAATAGGAPIRPIVSRITIHWPSFYNVVTGKTLALPNLIALQHIPLSPAGVIAKRPAPIALPNSCAA
jgi:hypothetical protein